MFAKTEGVGESRVFNLVWTDGAIECSRCCDSAKGDRGQTCEIQYQCR